MSNIFIKKLTIENFKCFENKSIGFNIPNGERGSGLNILIGENGNGKTSILEAINYLTQNSYATENKLKISDFRDYTKKILIKGETNNFNCKMELPWRGYFEGNGFEFSVKSRAIKESGKLLSSQFQVKNQFSCIGMNYKKEDGTDSGKEIPSLFKGFSQKRIDDDEINIFYFDKNRTRQITTGNYKTTFEKICDDLNWKFVNNLTSEKETEIINNVSGEYFKNVIEVSQKGTGAKVAEELKDFFSNNEYEKLKIDLLNLLHPFSNAFFAIRNDDELKQINTKDLGSGIEIILTLLLLKNIAGNSKGCIVYLIDEPELHLHPKAQEKLLELLLEESKNKQIFISTHSPYMFKGSLSEKTKLLILKRGSNNDIEIIDARDDGWGLFPKWSPTWGEINYFAYNLPTIEFHNELYGYLQSNAIDEDENNEREKEFDNYLKNKDLLQNKKWIRERAGVAQPEQDRTLQTYIRNYIHHPENESNEEFTDQELKQSIDEMINILNLKI